MPLYFTNLNSSTNSLASTKSSSHVIVSKTQPPPKITDVYVPAVGTTKRNPIRHYRRSLTDTSSTNNSLTREVFNQFGQPSKTFISPDRDCSQFSQKIYPNFTTEPSCPIPIKSASTVLDKNYSTSMRELRERKGRTYIQNLPTSHNKTGLSANCPENPENPIINNATAYSCNINGAVGAKSNSAYQHSRFYRSTNGTMVFINNDKCITCGDPVIILNKKNMNMTPNACKNCVGRRTNHKTECSS